MTERSRRSVLTGGFIALDAICQKDRLHHRAGGTAANVAANLAYLGWSAAVTGLIGKDAAGRRVRADLRRAGVNTALMRSRPEARTPVVVHEVLPSGHRFRFRCPACSRPLPRHRPLAPDDVDGVLARAARPTVFLFDRASEACLLLAEAMRDRGAVVVFEPSSRGPRPAVKRAFELAHLLRYSAERSPHLPDILRTPRAGQLQVRSAGGRGVEFRLGRDRWKRMAGVRAAVLDEAGAGDWLTAGFLEYLPSLSPAQLSLAAAEQALVRAQALAALSCAYPGARGLASVPLLATRRLVDLIAWKRSITSPPHQATARTRRARGDVCGTCLEGALV